MSPVPTPLAPAAHRPRGVTTNDTLGRLKGVLTVDSLGAGSDLKSDPLPLFWGKQTSERFPVPGNALRYSPSWAKTSRHADGQQLRWGKWRCWPYWQTLTETHPCSLPLFQSIEPVDILSSARATIHGSRKATRRGLRCVAFACAWSAGLSALLSCEVRFFQC